MTACSGRLLHTLTTLLLKLLAQILRRGLSLYNFLGWPLVDVYSYNVKSLSLSTMSMSFKIF